MMDELVAKFLPRFSALARERLRHALLAATERRREGTAGIAQELHALAGEAGLLGLDAVLDAARRAEEAARRFGATGAEADAIAFADTVRGLERAVTDATDGMRSS